MELSIFNHMVLVKLRKDSGHLPLPKRVVERVVDVGHGDAQARGCIAIDHQSCAQALVL